jgi:hypothetical protein
MNAWRTRCTFLVIDVATGSPAEGITFAVYGDGGWPICRLVSGEHGIAILDDEEDAKWVYMAEVLNRYWGLYEVGMIAWEMSDGTKHDNPNWPRKRP